MRRQESITNKIDWFTILIFMAMVLMGWFNIFAAVYDEQLHKSIFDTSLNSGKQLMWIGTTVVLIFIILVMDYKFYDSFAYIIYGFFLFLLIFVLLFARDIAGSRSWLELGPLRIQPAEFAKFATALGLAKFLSETQMKLNTFKAYISVGAIVLIPMLLIFIGDRGISLVFASFILVLYREGLTPLPIVIGLVSIALFILTLIVPQVYLLSGLALIGVIILLLIQRTTKKVIIVVLGVLTVMGVVFSVDYVIDNFMKPHQQNRIKALVNPDADPLGYGWNVTQSKIAIGSGGFIGKGFLQGTQTKFDFVPEQSTDFIFCTIGEEHGWVGSSMVVGLFVMLLLRIIYLADRQKSRFIRVYGYSVASIIFFHLVVNIGMTIGLVPVIGIPLPFFSYGGSSLWSFTILLFIFLKLDAHRMQRL